MDLSEKSRHILEAIAEGRSFEQILLAHGEWTYQDIFQAAAEALEFLEHPGPGKAYTLGDIRKKYPRAYERWSTDDDAELAEMHRGGSKPGEIAAKLQRQPSGVRSRLLKLNLIRPTPPYSTKLSKQDYEEIGTREIRRIRPIMQRRRGRHRWCPMGPCLSGVYAEYPKDADNKT